MCKEAIGMVQASYHEAFNQTRLVGRDSRNIYEAQSAGLGKQLNLGDQKKQGREVNDTEGPGLGGWVDLVLLQSSWCEE